MYSDVSGYTTWNLPGFADAGLSPLILLQEKDSVQCPRKITVHHCFM